MNLPVWLDLIIAFFLVAGSVFALIGAYGLAKLSDFLKRLHGPTKASTLGVGFVLIASMLFFITRGTAPYAHELLITLFVLLTAPISAHLLIKAAMRSDVRLRAPKRPDQKR